MKRLPTYPYLQNIVAEWRKEHSWNDDDAYQNYARYLEQFGFNVPVNRDYFEFPDDFSDVDLTMFILRWS